MIITFNQPTAFETQFFVSYYRRTISGWNDFIEKVNDTQLFKILQMSDLPGFSYMRLLELILKQDFRLNCPLAIDIEKEFVPAAKKELQQAVHLSADEGKRLLWNQFYKLQVEKAERLWPVGIKECFDAALEAIFKASPAFHRELWPFYRQYLELRYGLENDEPEQNQKKTIEAIKKKTMEYNNDFYDSNEVITRWITNVDEMLADEYSPIILTSICRCFSIKKAGEWQNMIDRFSAKDESENPNVLDRFVDELFKTDDAESDIILHSLNENGVHKVCQLVKLKKNDLLTFKRIGKKRIQTINDLLASHGLKLDMTKWAIGVWMAKLAKNIRQETAS